MFKHVLLAACLLTAGCATDPGFKFVPASTLPMRHPAEASGAVIWSHGACSICGIEQSRSPMPRLISVFRGWDIYRMDRPNMAEEARTDAAALVEHVAELKKQGYKRVVLAGQSGGGWISIIAAGRSADIDAVIALAPAWYGPSAGNVSPYFAMNSSALLDYLTDDKHARILLGFFQNDPYDPPGRSASAERVLAKLGIPHLVIDHPDGFKGHAAGYSQAFADRYGGCALALALGDPLPTECGSRSASVH